MFMNSFLTIYNITTKTILTLVTRFINTISKHPPLKFLTSTTGVEKYFYFLGFQFDVDIQYFCFLAADHKKFWNHAMVRYHVHPLSTNTIFNI